MSARSRFVDRAMAELAAVDRSMHTIERGISGAEALVGAGAHLHEIAELAARAGQVSVEELAREAETLTVTYLARPEAFGPGEADVVRHVLDVLSLLLRAARPVSPDRTSDGLLPVALAARDRIHYALRTIRPVR